MYEFLARNELYIVFGIALICWLGIFFYLIRLKIRIDKLEKTL